MLLFLSAILRSLLGSVHAGLVPDSSADSDRAFVTRVWSSLSAFSRYPDSSLVSGICADICADAPALSPRHLGLQRWNASLAGGVGAGRRTAQFGPLSRLSFAAQLSAGQDPRTVCGSFHWADADLCRTILRRIPKCRSGQAGIPGFSGALFDGCDCRAVLGTSRTRVSRIGGGPGLPALR